MRKRSARIRLSEALSLIAAAMLFSKAVEAQAQPAVAPARWCGARPSEAQFARVQQLAAQVSQFEPQPHSTEQWLVPLTIHVVRTSAGTGGVDLGEVTQAINAANVVFSGANIFFVQVGPTRYIDSDYYYSELQFHFQIDQLRQVDKVCGTVNVYFTEELADNTAPACADPPCLLCGESTFSTDIDEGVVIKNRCTCVAACPTCPPTCAVLAHELGHYFDLLHTHDTTFGVECVNGSNCSTAGDRICDTPADPGLSETTVDSNCQYQGNEVEGGCSHLAYQPNPYNVMSYAPLHCLYLLTPTQHGLTNLSLQVFRELEWGPVGCPCGMMLWAEPTNTGGGSGNQLNPYSTVTEAVNQACSGAFVYLKPGSFDESLTIATHMTLRAPAGTARVGQ